MVVAAGDDARTTLDAGGAGVLAVVQKPAAVLAGPADPPVPGTGSPTETREARDLVRLVKSMAQVKVVRRRAPERHQRAMGHPQSGGAPRPETPAAIRPIRTPQVVVVGASTGGPQALVALLSLLPADFPLAT